MNFDNRPLSAGFHLVAVPIGNARDITLRALDVLAQADVLAAEDTRSLRRLMDIHGVPLNGRTIVAYHDHSAKEVRARLIAEAGAGKSVAYASEAGTPIISDPGYALVRDAVAAGVAVTTAPGASAVIAALTVAGLPTDRFLFSGFLPSQTAGRRAALAELANVPATLCFYESPRRLGQCLSDMAHVLGAGRQAVVARELTKKFEELSRGPLTDLAEDFAERNVKGEIVVLVEGGTQGAGAKDLDTALTEALETMRVKDAADAVSGALGLPKRDVYQRALELKKSS